MDAYVKEEPVIEKGLQSDAEKETDQGKEEKQRHSLARPGRLRLRSLVDHKSGHQIVDDDTDGKTACRRKDRDIDGIFSCEGDELDDIAKRKIEDRRDKTDDGEAEYLPKEGIGIRSSLEIKLIEKNEIDGAEKTGKAGRQKGGDAKSRKEDEQDDMGKDSE